MPYDLRDRPLKSPERLIQLPYRIKKSTPIKRKRKSAQKGKAALRKLDLDHSYVGKVKPPAKPRKRQRHKRWKHVGEPLEDTTKLPRGWTDSEPDLSDDDWDAQIERCKERIEDNILVSRFKAKLETLEEEKAYREALIASEPRGLSWPVVQRLQSLIRIEKKLQQGDKYNKFAIVQTIMKAYRSGALEWHPGLVTYWSPKGQLCQPRPLDWAEFEQVQKMHPNETSFWIEGMDGPSPLPLYHHLSVAPNRCLMYYMDFTIRVPGTLTTSTVKIMEDTGASMLSLYEDDVRTLIVPKPSEIPDRLIIGYSPFTSSNGDIELPVVKLQVAVFWRGKEIMPYAEVQCALFEGKKTSRNSERLSGPMLRHRIYTATAPDAMVRLYLSNDRDELFDVLPDVDVSESTGPPNILLLPGPSA